MTEVAVLKAVAGNGGGGGGGEGGGGEGSQNATIPTANIAAAIAAGYWLLHQTQGSRHYRLRCSLRVVFFVFWIPFRVYSAVNTEAGAILFWIKSNERLWLFIALDFRLATFNY